VSPRPPTPSRAIRIALGALVASSALTLTTSGIATAADKPTSAALAEGRTHFLRGVDLYRDQDFRAALVEFRRANEVAPSYRILYNLGQTYYELQDYVGARSAFQEYLDQGGTRIPAARRTQVGHDLRKLEARVAYLTVTVDAEGALVAIDDVVVGTAPLSEPVEISNGERKITATLAGRGTVARTLEVAGGDHVTVNLELPRRVAPPPPPAPVSIVIPAPLPPVPPPPAPPPVPERSHTAAWFAGSTTVALTAATTVLGFVTLGARHDYDSALERFPTTPSDVNSARTKVRSLALATDIAGAGALVAAGATVFFLVRPGKRTAGLLVQPTGAVFTATF
jgi:hypothetical protein